MYVLIVHVLFIALFGLAFEKTVLYFCESKRERKKEVMMISYSPDNGANVMTNYRNGI